MDALTGKTCIITGGAGSLGMASARLFLAEGASVDDLTPRNVQAYFTRLMARRMGADLICDAATPGRLVMTVSIST